MLQTVQRTIVIRVPSEMGVSGARGQIVRVVGNSVAYVRLESGQSLAFSAEDIKRYSGQSFRRLGLEEGTPVCVTSDPTVDADVSLRLGGPHADVTDASLVNPEVEAMINAAVAEIPAEVWEAIGLAQKTLPVQPVEYGFSNVGACDAFESRH
jgi:hypothetical protein